MNIAIIDYGSGNLRSVAKAFEAVGASMNVTSDPRELVGADKIVLPGVGAYGDCMKGLSTISGMLDALNEQVMGKKKPFFGICVGMQLMFERGLEHGEHQGLGWLQGEVIPIIAPGRKIPHMGWNALSMKKNHPLFAGIDEGAHAYFVHSYHAKTSQENILATSDYGGPIVAVVGRDHMVGTQCHPEKSQETGLAILRNFLRM